MRLIAPLLLAGCGAPEEAAEGGCSPDDAPSLEIGVGSESWASVADAGGEATLIHGPQGGYHLELGLRARGLDVDDLASAQLTGSVGGEELAVGNTWVQFRCDPDTGAADAWNVRLIYEAQPEALDGQLTEIAASVTDAEGDTVEASASLRIVDPLVR